MNKRRLFWFVIAWFGFLSLFFTNEILNLISARGFNVEPGIGRLKEYGFYTVFLLGLLGVKMLSDKKRGDQKASKGPIFAVKVLLASYSISLVICLFLAAILYLFFGLNLLEVAKGYLWVAVLLVMVVLSPLVYSKLAK